MLFQKGRLMALTRYEKSLLSPAKQMQESAQEVKKGMAKREYTEPRPVKPVGSREWQCPFCHGCNGNNKRLCNNCNSHRYQWGNMDFAYQSSDGRKADTSTIQDMKEWFEDNCEF